VERDFPSFSPGTCLRQSAQGMPRSPSSTPAGTESASYHTREPSMGSDPARWDLFDVGDNERTATELRC